MIKLGQPWLACGVGALILAGVMIDRTLFQVPAADSYTYHERVRKAADTMPEVIGDWSSVPVEVPTAAQKLLRSNVLISREYTHGITQQKASFLLVQCSDARDLVGHYPPICYPNAGYTLVEQEPDERATRAPASGDAYRGTCYRFSQDTLVGTKAMWVYSLMVLPDGETAPNMEGIYRIAQTRHMRYFGAAQIQIITNVGMSEVDRSQVINMLLEGAGPLVDAIRSGVVQ